jgi:chromosome segregation ATPase
MLRLDILCLVEDFNGQLHLISREETVRNRIPFGEFEPEIEQDSDLQYVLQIQDIDCQGELKDQELHLDYFIEFMIIATQEQIVQLSAEEKADIPHSLSEVLAQLQTEVSRVEHDNRELRRRIYYYERDVSSLKKGIRKAEMRSSRLQTEINRYQEMVQQMQTALRDKDRRLQNLENPYYSPLKQPLEAESTMKEDLALGARIKRLFLNNS